MLALRRAEQILEADADQQLAVLDDHAGRPLGAGGSSARAGAGIAAAAPAEDGHDGDERGSRAGHRRTHQNETRLSAFAIEIVKIPM